MLQCLQVDCESLTTLLGILREWMCSGGPQSCSTLLDILEGRGGGDVNVSELCMFPLKCGSCSSITLFSPGGRAATIEYDGGGEHGLILPVCACCDVAAA